MKKIFMALFALAIILSMGTQTVLAGGGQVIGEKGEGKVIQNGPTPFGGETPAGPQS